MTQTASRVMSEWQFRGAVHAKWEDVDWKAKYEESVRNHAALMVEHESQRDELEQLTLAHNELGRDYDANLKELEESETSRKKLKDGVTALAQLYTEALAKIRLKCPRCQRFLDKKGKCEFCAKRLDHPDSKGATIERWLP